MSIHKTDSKASDNVKPEVAFLEKAKTFIALDNFDAKALENHIKTELKPGFRVDEKEYSFSRFISSIILFSPDQKTALTLIAAIHQIDDSLLVKVIFAGVPLLQRAVSRRYFEVVKYFTNTLDISIDEGGAAKLSALYCLVTDKMLSANAIKDRVEFLIKEGANPLFKDKKGQCPLSLTQSELLLTVMRQSSEWAKEIKEHDLMEQELDKDKKTAESPVASPKTFHVKPQKQTTSQYLLDIFGCFSTKEKNSSTGYKRLLQEEITKPASLKKTN